MKRIRHISLYLFFLVISVNSSIAAEPINTMCPVTTDEMAEPDITTTYHGQIIGFCCKRCLRKFNANPEAYIANLDLSALPGKQAQRDRADALPDEPRHQGVAARHDHAAERDGLRADFMGRVLTLMGKLHVLAVHMPIALLTIAALLELAGLWTHRPRVQYAARLNFVLGTLFAIVAAALGWIAASQSHYSGELSTVLTRHRWLGTAVAIVAAAGLLSLVADRLNCQWGKRVYRITLFLLVILVPLTAHFGGSLIYGTNYLGI